MPVGISQICTPLRKYAIVCIDNLTKNNFARESQTEQTIRLFAATVMAGLDQGSPKKIPIGHGAQALVTLASVAGNAFARERHGRRA